MREGEDGRRVYESASELRGVQRRLHRLAQRARAAEREGRGQAMDENGKGWGPLGRLRRITTGRTER